jgi:hypothetical protein
LNDLGLDLTAIDAHGAGGFDSQPHGAALNLHDGDRNPAVDDDRFLGPAGQNEHGSSS